MKLLIITQKVDLQDDNLGFFHRWIEKFAENLEEVFVICLSKGKENLPFNVKVFSLGKEKKYPKIFQLFLLQKYLLEILPKVDGVFFHMCPIYVICSFFLTKIFRKKMILWYAHKSVGWKLKIAQKMVDVILTTSRESCRLKNREKIKILGHGIDTDLFSPTKDKKDRLQNEIKLFSAGRITPIKDLNTLIDALEILVKEKGIKNILLEIAGTPLTKKEKEYFKTLLKKIKQKNLQHYIKFLGGVPYKEMPKLYQSCDIFLNLSHTGSTDKVVLEGMSCEVPVLTCNEAFYEILPQRYIFEKNNPQDLAKKIIEILHTTKRDKNLREVVIKNHNLDNLIKKIILEFKK